MLTYKFDLPGRTKKLAPIAFVLWITACTTLISPTEDTPPPNQTSIVEISSEAAEPTFTPKLQTILPEDMVNAWTLLQILKSQIIAGDDAGFAKHVRYPIQAVLDGRKTIFTDSGELANNLRALLTEERLQAVIGIREDDLVILPDGVRLANGTLWINLFCMDAPCTRKEFLITQINN